MSNIVNKLNELEKETNLNLGSSKSLNTLRAYRSDFADFKNFCSDLNLPYLPTHIKAVSLYMTHLSKSYKYSTLKRRLASINVIHNLKGYHIDTKNPLIKDNLEGIKRKIGVYQKGKKPLLINNLYKIIDVIDDYKIQKYVRSTRDKAIILIGFSGGFRRSEIVNLKESDLDFVEEGLKISLRRSKGDQYGEGMIKAIPYFNNKKYCAIIALKDWLSARTKKNDLIFPYSDKTVSLILKKYLNVIGLDSQLYSGHSLRSGFATSTASHGADERSIMAMTGHKSTEMVRRYIKESNLFKNNALDKLNN
ncbi:site-specific integrase [Pelagibacteraceae bacterium]|nr:site-specific integrase [Pelagibacteraceae bacterium]